MLPPPATPRSRQRSRSSTSVTRARERVARLYNDAIQPEFRRTSRTHETLFALDALVDDYRWSHGMCDHHERLTHAPRRDPQRQGRSQERRDARAVTTPSTEARSPAPISARETSPGSKAAADHELGPTGAQLAPARALTIAEQGSSAPSPRATPSPPIPSQRAPLQGPVRPNPRNLSDHISNPRNHSEPSLPHDQIPHLIH